MRSFLFPSFVLNIADKMTRFHRASYIQHHFFLADRRESFSKARGVQQKLKMWARPDNLLIHLSYALIIACLVDASPMVHIKNGTLMGSTMRTRLGKEFVSYRGIPYALPPVGPRRFKVKSFKTLLATDK